MPRKTTFLPLLVTVLLPVATFAATYSYFAETAAPASRQGLMQAGGLNWRCQGVRCTSVAPNPVSNLAQCVALARIVGPLRAFGTPSAPFGAKDLAACNSSAGGQTAAAKEPSKPPPPNQPTGSAPQQATRPGVSPATQGATLATAPFSPRAIRTARYA